MAAVGRRRRTHRVQANINVTSLLDITFVLLISFMVVAPALKHGIDLELPKVREAKTVKNDKPISVQVKPGIAEAEIYVDGQAVGLAGMVSAIQSKQKADRPRAITLEADRRVDWQQMARVISDLRNAGITDLGILTAPLKGG